MLNILTGRSLFLCQYARAGRKLYKFVKVLPLGRSDPEWRLQLLLPREVAKPRPCTSQSFPPLCSSKRALPFIRLRLLTARHASEAPVIAERCSRALTCTLLVSGPAACCVGRMKQSRSANNNTPHDAVMRVWWSDDIFKNLNKSEKAEDAGTEQQGLTDCKSAFGCICIHFFFFYIASLFFTLICYFAFKTRTQLHPIKVPNYANSDHACDFLERLRRF